MSHDPHRKTVAETSRLIVRWLDTDDAEFLLELFNDPDWLKYINDKGIRTVEQARQYVIDEPMKYYAEHGMGPYAVDLKETGETLGITCLINRETLDDIDVGFAFLPRFRNRGFAKESTLAIMEYGKKEHAIARLVAVTTQDNEPSQALLAALGFEFEKLVQFESESIELQLWGRSLD